MWMDTRLHFHILFIRIYRLILNSLACTQYFINRLVGSFSTQEKDQPPKNSLTKYCVYCKPSSLKFLTVRSLWPINNKNGQQSISISVWFWENQILWYYNINHLSSSRFSFFWGERERARAEERVWVSIVWNEISNSDT